MTKSAQVYQLLKQAQGAVSSLIAYRTPPVEATLLKASRSLARAKAAQLDVVEGEVLPQSFTFAVQDVIAELSKIGGDFCSNPADVAKAITAPEFAAYVRDEIEKAIAADAAPSLALAYSLRRRIGKAIADFEKFASKPEEIESFTFYREDATEAAALQKSIAEEVAKATNEEEIKKASSPALGLWSTGEVDVTKGQVDALATLTAAVASIEKSATMIAGRGRDGWAGFGNDINSPAFLTGVAPEIDFGPDPVRQ